MTQAILASLDAVNKELKSIGKNQDGYGYKFRGIDDVLNSLNPLFKKHGIVTLRRDVVSERNVRRVTDKYGKEKDYVEATLRAKYVFKSLVDGSELVSEGFGEGQDTTGGDKASSMATSNAYKYVIFEMFNIATNEQRDSDQVTAEVNKPSPTATSSKSAQGEVGTSQSNALQTNTAPKPSRFRRSPSPTPTTGASDDI